MVIRRSGAAALLAAVLFVVGIGIDVSAGSGSTRPARLAYVTAAASAAPQVWLASLRGGAKHRVGPGQYPALSPDGAVVAASTPERTGPALILYRAGGSVLRRLFDAARATATAEAWSPDSRYLAVVLSSRDPASAANSGLIVLDVDTMTWSLVARGAIYGASFAPGGSDRLVYAAAPSSSLTAPVDIFTVGADDSGTQRLTQDGLSLYPVWGRAGIAFDREQLRLEAAPAYELWMMNADGSHPVQLTRMPLPPLMDGLVPIAFAGDDGGWLLAQYEGLNTSQAWAVAPATGQARRLEIAGAGVTAAALSRSGATALVDLGGFLRPPDHGTVEELPLGGGAPIKLALHASEPSWNQ